MDELIKTVPWVTKIGHEMTFMPKKKFSERMWKAFTKSYRTSAEESERGEYFQHLYYLEDDFSDMINKKKIHRDCCSTDDHCIEISSEPIKNWKSFISWNNKVRAIADNVGLTPEIEDFGGGMGHHHIDAQNDDVRDFLFRFLAERPYLAWIFTHPSDVQNAQSIAQWFLAFKDVRDSRFTAFAVDEAYPGGRGAMMTCRNDTIEWRAFDAAIDIEMQIEHTSFLQALVGYAKKNATNCEYETVWRKSEYYWESTHQVKIFKPLFKSIAAARNVLKKHQDYETCVAGFAADLKTLGLPKHRYERYLQNIAARIEWKTAR